MLICRNVEGVRERLEIPVLHNDIHNIFSASGGCSFGDGIIVL